VSYFTHCNLVKILQIGKNMKLYTCPDLARRLEIDTSTVLRSKHNGILQKARHGMKIDVNHPDAKRFIKKHELRVARVKRMRLAKEKEQPEQSPSESPEEEYTATNTVDLADLPDDIRKLADKPLRELIRIFGTDTGMETWLKAAKSIEDLHEKRLKNESTEGKLIAREYVEKHIFGFLDGVFTRLLNDSPKTISSKAVEMAEAGETS